jgi:hypothetical protein
MIKKIPQLTLDYEYLNFGVVDPQKNIQKKYILFTLSEKVSGTIVTTKVIPEEKFDRFLQMILRMAI